MHKRCAPRFAAGADGGEQRDDAGADIHAENNGNRRRKRNASRCRKRLQNANGGGGALDDCGDNGARKHAEDGAFKQRQDPRKLRNIRKRFHSAAHRLHAEHEDGKTKQNRADIPAFVAFGKQQEGDANHCKHRGEGGRLQ